MFEKINLSLDDLDIDRLKGGLAYSNPPFFYEFDIKDKFYLYKSLQKKVNFKIRPLLVNITEICSPGAHPHCDKWNTSLNYYFNASGEITTFWKAKNQFVDFTKTTHGTLRYTFENLNKVDWFIADKNDCFLMNTHEIHSVEVKNEPRTILRFIWVNYNFQKILNSIEILR